MRAERTAQLCAGKERLLLLDSPCQAACRRPKGHRSGTNTTKGYQQALLRQHVSMPQPQQAAQVQQGTAGQTAIPGSTSARPSQLAASLARLQKLEESELRGPLSQQTQPADAAAIDGQRRVGSSAAGIHKSAAAIAHDDRQQAGHGLTSKVEQRLPPALQRHAVELSSGSRSSTDGTYSSPPEGGSRMSETPWKQKGPSGSHESILDALRAGRGEVGERQVLSNTQNTLAATLPKLAPQMIGQASKDPQSHMQHE